MSAEISVTEQYEADRAHLRAVAYRLLGSLHDADDAVQGAWLKINGAAMHDVRNPTGWFTTVVARECLDQLRARKRRGEVSLAEASSPATTAAAADEEVALAESVGRALLVVLDRLSPAQRVAFVLHDMFAIPFDDIAALLDRSTVAAKKLASRARERVHAKPSAPQASTAEHLRLAAAFLSASQRGNMSVLLELLAPDVVRRVDRVLVPDAVATEVHGAANVAEETKMFAKRARAGAVAMVDGSPGIVIAPAGRLEAVLRLRIRAGRIEEVDIIGEPRRLASVTITVAGTSTGRPAPTPP
jgi:RNA polymerase sigma-70 factor (ECF subfamily)